MMNQDLFQALHSPIGANAGFAMGLLNGGGGFSLEKERIPDQDLFIGYQEKGTVHVLPFYKNAVSEKISSFVKESAKENSLFPFQPEEVKRTFQAATDSFEAGRLRMDIMNRICKIEDPEQSSGEQIKEKILPAVLAKLCVDNSDGDTDLTAFFAVGDMKGKQFLSRIDAKRCGVITREGYGFEVITNEPTDQTEIADFDMVTCFQRTAPVVLMLAPMGGILFRVPAGHRIEADLALGFYKDGESFCGAHCGHYLYQELYKDLPDVLSSALLWKDRLWEEAYANDRYFAERQKDPVRYQMTAQAVKSYYISSMLMREDTGKIRWVVNEGTFLMMNTFDLMIDHLFFELRFHPWTIRNQLDFFAEAYCYYDQYGISFTHDMGSHHVFTPDGTSSYEIPNLTGCFSFMTQEQLCNWILAAAVYWYQTKDQKWLESRKEILTECLLSLKNRDGKPMDGIMDKDSELCGNGSEITTYDSLDISLGQSRRNTYIAMKCFASYLALNQMLNGLQMKQQADEAASMAALCGKTIIRYYDTQENYFPAILDGKGTMAIIPIIEGVIYPYFFGRDDVVSGQGEYEELIKCLKQHMETVLKEGICLFEDGGWKLSQTSDNSWMSKIFLCQFITEKILHVAYDRKRADLAHQSWWVKGCPSCAGIDQIFAGGQTEKGFHYPRAVTSILWMEDTEDGIRR